MNELPPVPTEHIAAMTKFFEIGKILAGDRLPKITRESVEEWARALPEICGLPEMSMRQVIVRWSNEHTTQRMATTGDIRAAFIAEKKAWEKSPEGRAWKRAHDRRMEDLRDQQLRDGTFSQLRYRPVRELSAPSRDQEKISSMIQAARKKLEEARKHE